MYLIHKKFELNELYNLHEIVLVILYKLLKINSILITE